MNYTINDDVDKTITGTETTKIYHENGHTSISVYENMQNEYHQVLPQNLDIFNDVKKKIGEIKDELIKKQITNFFVIFQNMCLNIFSSESISNYLSKLYLSILDDSVIIEWNYDNFRIGYVFEQDATKSSYYRVMNDSITGKFESCSQLLNNNYSDIIFNSINFVLSYT